MGKYLVAPFVINTFYKISREEYMKVIARIRTDFPEKFGVPRQSGLVKGAKGMIIFEKEYRNPQAFRGLEGFSHIWVIWEFSKAIKEEWSPMVKPPRLGGNKRMGVFATRSPFRPNPIGLSSLKLERIEMDNKFGPVLIVSGVDMVDNTPIYDIKPYLPYTDCHEDATDGFAGEVKNYELKVEFPKELLDNILPEYHSSLIEVLQQDPRPGYVEDGKEFGVSFAKYNIRFRVEGNVLTVVKVEVS
jgi:tRNA-Thr(GGU) m(6)t(6)A37 methyltransferase TsaA